MDNATEARHPQRGLVLAQNLQPACCDSFGGGNLIIKLANGNMNIEQANQLIQQTVNQLNLDYGGCLFDEWALVEIRKGKSDLLLYGGPRKASFLTQLPTDMAPLSHSFRDGTLLQLGEYDFARNATGSQIDAAACVGKNIYLLFNNMTVAMADICRNERWLGAQQTFFSLCERFRSDPVSLTHQM